jgi:hypothetical protein
MSRVPAVIFVTDSVTGALQGVIEGTALTSLRSAAMGAVAAMACMKPSARTVAVLGGGQIVGAALRPLAGDPQIETLWFIAGSPDRARSLLDRALSIAGRKCDISLIGYRDVIDPVAGLTATVQWYLDRKTTDADNIEKRLGDPFDYPTEDRLAGMIREFEAKVLEKIVIDHEKAHHPYAHPDKPNQATDQRGR